MTGGPEACPRRSISNCCCKRAKRPAAKPARRPALSTANQSRPPRAADRAATMRPRRSRAVSAHRDRHLWSACRCRDPSRRHPRSRRRPAGHRGHPSAVSLATPSFRRQRLQWPQPAGCPHQIRQLDHRDRQTCHRRCRVSAPSTALGCRTDPCLAQSKPPPGKRLRGDDLERQSLGLHRLRAASR